MMTLSRRAETVLPYLNAFLLEQFQGDGSAGSFMRGSTKRMCAAYIERPSITMNLSWAYEEPHLRRRFSREYDTCRKRVNRRISGKQVKI
jgi:hypothetical protein